MQHSYINPFPTGDRYRILVIGDSLGDGLWQGLYRAFEEDKNLEFTNRSKASGGLVRTDSNNWDSQLADIMKNDTFQIAVVMFGANDDQAELAPEVILASAVLDIPSVLLDTVGEIKDGRFDGKTESVGMKEGYVWVAYNKKLEDKIPADIRKKADALVKEIKNGEMKVPRKVLK